MGFRYEIRLSGDVGHGLILIGKILAEAAAIYENYNAIQSQSYGEEARSEANRADVIISDGDIVYPKIENPDLLLCFTQTAYDKYTRTLKPNGILIYDSSRVVSETKNVYREYDFPIFLMTREQFGSEPLAGIVALGIVADFIEIISPRAIQQALMARIPKGMERLNEKALKLGYQMSRQERQSLDIQNEAP
ncbi:MAG: 2-oxoacid:acceptor oxidoreductase family protein [Calditrichia bacterium]